jgi:hypothetical protein
LLRRQTSGNRCSTANEVRGIRPTTVRANNNFSCQFPEEVEVLATAVKKVDLVAAANSLGKSKQGEQVYEIGVA